MNRGNRYTYQGYVYLNGRNNSYKPSVPIAVTQYYESSNIYDVYRYLLAFHGRMQHFSDNALHFLGVSGDIFKLDEKDIKMITKKKPSMLTDQEAELIFRFFAILDYDNNNLNTLLALLPVHLY